MGALYWAVVDPSVLPDVTGLPTERAQDRYVEARRSLGAAEVIADYETVSSKALDRLTGLLGAGFEVPLGDLGTYPARVLPTAFCFDHYLHIRADMFAPRGPLTGDPPRSDELRLVPALDWAEAALPQQNGEAIATLTGPVAIQIEGSAARTIHLGSGDGPESRITSTAPAFLRWITQRASWEETSTEATGDAQALATVRRLKVF